jgi:hypothetical protein
MNRETRDKFASGTDQSDLTTGNACWETAPLIFAQLNEDFGPFDIDLTADSQRHLCPMWFGPDSPADYGTDALFVAWHLYGSSGFSNPPYGSFVPRMFAKASDQSWHGFTTTMLPPLRITKGFHAHVLNGAAEVILPDKRLVFFENGVPRINAKMFREKGRATADCALFDSCIVRYVPGHVGPPALKAWKVPPHVTKQDLDRAAERMAAAIAAEAA